MRWALLLLAGCGGSAFSSEQPTADAQLLEQLDASSSTTSDVCPCPSSDRPTTGDGSSADVVDELLEHGPDASADVVDELLEHRPDASADVALDVVDEPRPQCMPPGVMGVCPSPPWIYGCNGQCCLGPC